MDRPDKDSSRTTYSDAMNEWAAQQSYFRRIRSGIFHPGEDRTPIRRVFGYAWRALAALAVLAALFYYGVKGRLKSPDFREGLASETGELLKAKDVTLQPLQWKWNSAVTSRFEAHGGPESFFRRIEAEYLRFEVPLSDLFGSAWNIRTLQADRLRVNLRSGGLGEIAPEPEAAPATRPADAPQIPALPSLSDPLKFDVPAIREPSDAKPSVDFDINIKPPVEESEPLSAPSLDDSAAAGGQVPAVAAAGFSFGIDPDFESLSIGRIRSPDTTLVWGLTEVTQGSITSAHAEIRPARDGWVAELFGGTISQNWLRGLQFERLEALCTPKRITIAADDLSTARGGKAALMGDVIPGDLPTLNLTLELKDVPVADLLPSDGAGHTRRFGGLVSGPARLAGSTNTSEGVVVDLDFTLREGVVQDVPLLNSLALITSNSFFRSLPIHSGAGSLSTGGGRLEVRDLILKAPDGIELRGEFVRDPDGIITGALSVGVPRSMLETYPQLRERNFQAGDGDLLWIETPLNGRLDELTRTEAERLQTEYREAEERRRKL